MVHYVYKSVRKRLILNIIAKWQKHHQEGHLKIWTISWLSKFWKIPTMKWLLKHSELFVAAESHHKLLKKEEFTT